MKICEIYAGIQGESTNAGLPCVFIRLTGCNLRCSYCDSVYSYEEGREMSREEILGEVGGYGLGLVELTGGEPLLQDGVRGLAEALIGAGYRLLIETNGSLDIGGIDLGAAVIMDIKTPGSGAAGSLRTENLGLLKAGDEVKFVLTDRADYEWAVGMVDRHGLTDKAAVLFSPAYGRLEPAALAEWIVRDRLKVRLNLQLHKLMYDKDRRRV
jgi:7-carboxy-7-deazaguanine synthase